jgi:hypothetical protein
MQKLATAVINSIGRSEIHEQDEQITTINNNGCGKTVAIKLN